jgi:hypothetical protein
MAPALAKSSQAFNQNPIMTTPRKILQWIAYLLSAIIFFTSCKKDNDVAGFGYMQVQMTDAPGDYEHVYVDVRSVEVQCSDSNDAGGWKSLNTRVGVYDLILLQNDLTSVLADSTVLPTGKVSQLRLVLGDNNAVVFTGDSISYPLSVPSGMKTGIKINLNTYVEAGLTIRVVIDFDADKSVNQMGNGAYDLRAETCDQSKEYKCAVAHL